MKKKAKNQKVNRRLKKGDPVMVISGGNKNKRVLKGQTGSILRFVGSDRVVVEGLNMIVRHQKATGPEQPGGKVEKEAALNISNVMYYVEKIKRPVRVKYNRLDDGRKVRGYLEPESKKFVQID